MAIRRTCAIRGLLSDWRSPDIALIQPERPVAVVALNHLHLDSPEVVKDVLCALLHLGHRDSAQWEADLGWRLEVLYRVGEDGDAGAVAAG